MGDAHPPRQKQSYLLDPRFQLKWTGFLVSIVLFVMTALGVVIAITADQSANSARVAVEQARKAAEESKANSILARRSVQLAAPDNPILAQVMDESLEEVDKKEAENLAEVERRHADIESGRRRIRILLGGSGVALLVLLVVMGVVITHRIVGPVHKMKRLLRRVSTGRLSIDERLRKGDELEDLFDTFLQMTYSLRAIQRARLATLDGTLKRAEATGTSAEVLEGLRALRAQMVLGLEPRRTSVHPGSDA